MFFEYIEIKGPNLEISIKLLLANSYSIGLYYLSISSDKTLNSC